MRRGRLVLGLSAFLLMLLVVSSGGWVTAARADTDHVTNCSDGDPGSLRAVVNAAASGDTIVFDVDCFAAAQITLSSEILVTGKAVTVDGTGHQVTISGGDASRIFNAGAAGTLTLKHLTLTHGAAGDGGALAVTGTLTLLDITVSNSTASNFGGGAAGVFGGGTLAVQGSTFIGNSAPNMGGAIFNNASTVTIETSTFTGNQGVNGGGIGTISGTLIVEQSTFAGNTVDHFGGASYAQGGAQVSITNSTLTNNTAQFGGGVMVVDATATLTNDTLSGNHFAAGGAGSEMASNAHEITISNSIVAGTSGTNCDGPLTDDGNNLQSGDTTCGFSLTGDPLLGPLADNGGPTQTMALGQGSPAIDAANPAICNLAAVGNVDQRGFTRLTVVRNFCDTGAYDTQGVVPGAPSGATTGIDRRPGKIAVGGATSTITVYARDPSGTALTVGGATVRLQTTLGSLSAVTDNHNGTYTATLTSGTVSGTAMVSGTINGQTIAKTAGVAFKPGPPSGATTVITSNRQQIPADGQSTATITVIAKDQYGNIAQAGGATVLLHTTAGNVGAVSDVGNGRYQATLTSGTSPLTASVYGTINKKQITSTVKVQFT